MASNCVRMHSLIIFWRDEDEDEMKDDSFADLSFV